ncbi:MAG: hypothetical protein IT462_05220 [Planctomycetes bacterium]|nr:hypothetical protein [Planctomycetota bacterium]
MSLIDVELSNIIFKRLHQRPINVAPGQYTVLRALQPKGGTEKDIDALTDRVAAQALVIQALVIQALVTYLETSPGFDGKKFAQILHDIDAADGVVDGKIGAQRPPKPEAKAPKTVPKAR